MKRDSFGSRWAVIFAMAGSAIGLGNIWRFPYVVGEHGGSAFIIIYLACTLLVSLPIFIAEVVIGRRSRIGAFSAMSSLRPGHKIWKYAGYLSIITPTLICSYYSVIGGWSLGFLFKSLSGTFIDTSPEAATGIFSSFLSSSWEPVLMHLLFLSLSCHIVANGVKSGIERFSKWSIPILFMMILLILVYSLTLPGSGAGVTYLFKPDFHQIDGKSFSYALGQSFYSLSIGAGTIMTYGSYVSKKENIVATSTGTAVSDLMFAILAGLAIMPAVFAAGIAPGSGPGLIFQTIPFIFSKMGQELPIFSAAASILFFVTVVVAAITSCISLVEVGTTFLIERFGWSRKRAVWAVFILCGSLGTLCALQGKALDVFDWFCSNVLLILLAGIVAVFTGFILPKEDVWEEVTNGGSKPFNVKVFPILYFLIKWVAPIAIVIIFISNLT